MSLESLCSLLSKDTKYESFGVVVIKLYKWEVGLFKLKFSNVDFCPFCPNNFWKFKEDQMKPFEPWCRETHLISLSTKFSLLFFFWRKKVPSFLNCLFVVYGNFARMWAKWAPHTNVVHKTLIFPWFFLLSHTWFSTLLTSTWFKWDITNLNLA